MGGCRCTFRQCPNNTINSSGKHFFHFPYKDNERCKRWAVNSDSLAFLNLPWTQLRNKTVCEDHFMEKCFMNYKKERLIKTAVPTLLYKDGVLHEIEDDEQALATVHYSFNEQANDSRTIDLPSPAAEYKPMKIEKDYYNVSSASLLQEQSEQQPKLNLTPVVLNKTSGRPVKRFAVRNVQQKNKMKRIDQPDDAAESSSITINRSVPIDDTPVPVSIGKTYRKNVSHNVVMLKEESMETEAAACDAVPSTITANILEKINNIEERDANKVDKSLYMQMMAEQAKQIENLKKLLTEKFSEAKEVQTQKVSSSTSSADVRTIRVEKGPAMTKVQLFNGIRKYLNPTMVALLRMEMFGGAEREYRPDEKQFSKELYNLNQTVYDYMRDEWRFRLPPKSMVETWLKTPDDEETWELC